jgi:hypothetical protein
MCQVLSFYKSGFASLYGNGNTSHEVQIKIRMLLSIAVIAYKSIIVKKQPFAVLKKRFVMTITI